MRLIGAPISPVGAKRDKVDPMAPRRCPGCFTVFSDAYRTGMCPECFSLMWQESGVSIKDTPGRYPEPRPHLSRLLGSGKTRFTLRDYLSDQQRVSSPHGRVTKITTGPSYSP